MWRAACRGFGGSAARGFHVFATEKRAAKTARARAEPREPAARLSDGGEAPAVALTGARLLFVPQARKREGGTYRYKTKTVAFISIATPCRAPRVVALVALAAKKNPLHPSRV